MVLRYRTFLTRLRVPLLAIVLFVLALGSLGCVHVTHLTCTKAADSGDGQCSYRSYSGFGVYEQTMAIGPGDAFSIRVSKGSKGSPWAVVTLRNTTIGSGSFRTDHFDPDVARAAAARFETFQKTRSATTFDAWFRESVIVMFLMLLISAVLFTMSVLMVRETVTQRRWITIVIDHDRRVVGIGGQEVGFDEIRLVGVDTGKALFWASAKNEHIPGYRVFIELMDGIRVFATRDYRAGPGNTAEQAHEAIKTRIAREVGLHLRAPQEGKPIGVGGGRRKAQKKG